MRVNSLNKYNSFVFQNSIEVRKKPLGLVLILTSNQHEYRISISGLWRRYLQFLTKDKILGLWSITKDKQERRVLYRLDKM